mgnify:CR=1 FL=1|tara:strand:- start:5 stop:628 length:624 start_codon:yes stop_codon:yes gene_type:complete
MKRSVKDLSDRQITNRQLAWFYESTEQERTDGMLWYKEAQDFVYEQYHEFKDKIEGLTPYKVAGVVSATSPNNRWEQNKKDTITVLKAIATGLPPEAVKICTYNKNKVKAFEVGKGNVELTAKSPKTHSFAMNVGLNSPDHITIDKWHLRACVTTPKDGVVDCVESCTAVQYRRIEAITAEIAKRMGMKGYELQAIIWVTIKRVWNR